MTLFAITNYHWPICWMISFIQFVRLSSPTAFTTGNPVYLISTKGTRRVWPVSGGCLLLLGTWSYLCICRRSMLPYTRFCNCLLDYGYVLHIVNFAILCYTNIRLSLCVFIITSVTFFRMCATLYISSVCVMGFSTGVKSHCRNG
jgi:hypothetical protein